MLTTTLVAVCDHAAGTSTPRCSKIVSPLLVGDHRVALLPLDGVEGVDPGAGVAAVEAEAGRFGRRRSRLEDELGWVVGRRAVTRGEGFGLHDRPWHRIGVI